MNKYINHIICGDWYNLYDESWKDLIVPEAFAHPAKMAYGLTRKIFKHALSEGWIKAGEVVVDPFGGIGSTGLVGACFGFQVVCVELEQKFVDLAKQNFDLHRKSIETFTHFGKPLHPIIIQGDSRKLSEIIGSCDCVVGSPPYEPNTLHADGIDPKAFKEPKRAGGNNQATTMKSYGQTPGQLGAMKPGNIEMVISSPYYAETLKGDGTQNETAAESRAKRITPGGSLGQSQRTQGYGSKGNLGNLKPGQVDAIVSSPPFMLSDNRNGDKNNLPRQGKSIGPKYSEETPTDGIAGGDRNSRKAKLEQTERVKKVKNLGHIVTMGNDGQLINTETFWAAAKTIVSKCHKILKPGGYAIWVVKSFVRNKKIVDFPGDWRKLCESLGFETVHEHHAMLVKEERKPSLFGHEIVKVKERKSFFRRLAEQKGSPRIDFETVLCMRKALFE